MPKFRLTRNGWIILGVVSAAGLFWLTGPIGVATVLGLAGGMVIGANLPDKTRSKFVVVGKRKKPSDTFGG